VLVLGVVVGVGECGEGGILILLREEEGELVVYDGEWLNSLVIIGAGRLFGIPLNLLLLGEGGVFA
jgi:hypothetical protein